MWPTAGHGVPTESGPSRSTGLPDFRLPPPGMLSYALPRGLYVFCSVLPMVPSFHDNMNNYLASCCSFRNQTSPIITLAPSPTSFHYGGFRCIFQELEASQDFGTCQFLCLECSSVVTRLPPSPPLGLWAPVFLSQGGHPWLASSP